MAPTASHQTGSETSKTPPRAWMLATILAVAHFALVIGVGIFVLVDLEREHESPMLWIFPFYLDVPVSFFMASIHFENWGQVSWIPGLAGEWANWLGPLLFLSLIGSLWWYCLGWLGGWSYSKLQRPRGNPPPSR